MPARRTWATAAGALLSALGLALSAAPAHAQDPAAAPAAAPTFRPGVAERGWIKAELTGTPGSHAAITEEVGGADVAVTTLTLAGPTAGRAHLAPWRCDRRRRTFVLTETRPDGSAATVRAGVLTPACRHRLTLQVLGNGKPRVGQPVSVVVGDRFGVGAIDGRVCLQSAGDRTCTVAHIPPGQATARVRVRPGAVGPARVTLAGPAGQRLSRTVDVRRRPGPLTLLTTGDSDIQILQDFLADDVEGHGVRTVKDDHISTGISNPGPLDWPAHAAGIAGAVHPDVSVVFLGGNEGFGMPTPSGTTAPCCGDAWVQEFARRAREMMRSLSRGGAGHVYWLLVPPPHVPPRTGAFAGVIDAVNRGYVLAAKSFPDTVTLIDLRRTFPAGSARQPDGYHLTTGDDRALARMLAARLRRDGVL